MTRSLAWLIPSTLLGCSRSAGPPPERAPSETAAAAAAPTTPAAAVPRDSTWVDVRGPTLVAFWPAHAQAVIDSGGDGATALDDFGYHLSSADSVLRALGFRVVSVEGPGFHVVSGGRATAFAVPRDSAALGYYLVAPGRAPVVSYGVQTDADLVATARRYLAAGVRRP